MTARTRLRVALAAGTAVLLGAVATSSAAYVDRANLNLAARVGSPDRFDIGLVLADGTVAQGDTDAGVDWAVAGAEDLVPGHAVTTEIPVFVNTPALAADTTVEIVLRGTDGAVAPDVPNITPALRFTGRTSDGTVLFADVAWAEARGSLGVLAARGGDALAAGEAYAAGAAGSAETLTLTVAYPDAPGVEDLNGGRAALSVRFNATSVRP